MPSTVLVIDDSDKIREQIIRTVMNVALFDNYREVGIACYPSSQVDSISSLFRQADYALYRAKQNGRNRVEIADDNLSVASA